MKEDDGGDAVQILLILNSSHHESYISGGKHLYQTFLCVTRESKNVDSYVGERLMYKIKNFILKKRILSNSARVKKNWRFAQIKLNVNDKPADVIA